MVKWWDIVHLQRFLLQSPSLWNWLLLQLGRQTSLTCPGCTLPSLYDGWDRLQQPLGPYTQSNGRKEEARRIVTYKQEKWISKAPIGKYRNQIMWMGSIPKHSCKSIKHVKWCEKLQDPSRNGTSRRNWSSLPQLEQHCSPLRFDNQLQSTLFQHSFNNLSRDAGGRCVLLYFVFFVYLGPFLLFFFKEGLRCYRLPTKGEPQQRPCDAAETCKLRQ